MITRQVMLYFPQCETEKPIVSHLVKEYDLIINIFRAKVTPDEEGFMVLQISGEDSNITAGLDYVAGFGVKISEHESGVRWDEERCIHCGTCVPHCPTKALDIPDRDTMKVVYSPEKCVECLSCVEVCPYKVFTSLI